MIAERKVIGVCFLLIFGLAVGLLYAYLIADGYRHGEDALARILDEEEQNKKTFCTRAAMTIDDLDRDLKNPGGFARASGAWRLVVNSTRYCSGEEGLDDRDDALVSGDLNRVDGALQAFRVRFPR